MSNAKRIYNNLNDLNDAALSDASASKAPFELSASDKKAANAAYKFIQKFGELHLKAKQKMPTKVLNGSIDFQDYLFKFMR